jgi:hypothetical protein
MNLRSMIDYNEMMAIFKDGTPQQKTLHDSMVLETVMYLSGRKLEEVQHAAPRHIRRAGAASFKKGVRLWGVGNGRLTHPGRVFKIMRTKDHQPLNGQSGGVWAKIIATKGETISYPAIETICKAIGVPQGKASAMAGQLWSRGFLDVTEQPGERAAAKKIGDAY